MSVCVCMCVVVVVDRWGLVKDICMSYMSNLSQTHMHVSNRYSSFPDASIINVRYVDGIYIELSISLSLPPSLPLSLCPSLPPSLLSLPPSFSLFSPPRSSRPLSFFSQILERCKHIDRKHEQMQCTCRLRTRNHKRGHLAIVCEVKMLIMHI